MAHPQHRKEVQSVQEEDLWQSVTEIAAEKQDVWLALPKDHPDGLKQKVLGSTGNR